MEDKMKLSRFWLIGLVLLMGVEVLPAIVVNGGKGLPHTKSAFTTRKGQFWLQGQIRFWGKSAEFEYPTLGIESGSTIWVVQQIASFNYGVSNHLSIALSPILYQDTHQDKGEDLIGDALLDFKFGNYRIEKKPLWLGFNIGTRLPLGSQYNIVYEDYSSGRFEFGVSGILTWRYAAADLKNDYRIHTNIGYWNHLDKGVNLVEGLPREYSYVTKPSQSFNYALGLEFPTQLFDYGLEVYGISWITQPPAGAAGRENYLFMNVSIGYKPHPRFKFYTNADLRLSENRETTVPPRVAFSGAPNYPGWRIYLGLRFLVLPTSLYDMHTQTLQEIREEKRRTLKLQLEHEKRKTEAARQEVERLQAEKEKKERDKSSKIVMEEKK